MTVEARRRRYEPQKTELEAQRRWSESGIFERDCAAASGVAAACEGAGRSTASPGQKAFYCLEMFPYPSGKLHMGHVRNYTIGDAIARFQRMRGGRVIYPMGFDAFGLPAENAAIQGKSHPRVWTDARMAEMIGQMKRMGFSYDWNRHLATCRPDYYRWNQWFFLRFWERDLAYRKEAPVNWCPKCNTVLANEQVHDGMCWRHEETAVEQRSLAQWFFRTTAYADRLLKNLDSLPGWPDHVKEMQRHWIGRSDGAILRFPVSGSDDVIETYTTRPDTVYGVTYLVLAPEHPMVDRLVDPARRDGLEEFRRMAAALSTTERTDATKPKHGYSLGRDFVNPFTGTTHPLFVADYALMDYGTGAVMAVPAHDQRDFEFARRHGLPVRAVIHPDGAGLRGEEMDAAYVEDGTMRDSGPFDGRPNRAAWKGIVALAEEKGWGRPTVQYRLRDWLVSRQRYWGTPIPAIYCDKCGVVPNEDLPVLLPEDVRFDTGGNPLATSPTFVGCSCPRCGGSARRETDTMDTFVDSSWYFLRYCDAKNEKVPFDASRVRDAMPVDQYIGGVEHACMHLIYARFFTMVLHDMGMVACEEPFTNLLTQGMVSLETYRCPRCDWILPTECVEGKCVHCGGAVVVGPVEKMSKSKKNTIDPGEIIGRYGADTARVFILFASPPEKELLWSDQAVEGSFRFLRRVHDLIEERAGMEPGASAAFPEAGAISEEAEKELRRKTHDTIARVTRDISTKFQFNTAIAALMELLNAISSHGRVTPVSIEAVRTMVVCLAPIAPHLAEDLWTRLGEDGLVAVAPWPEADAEALMTDTVEVPVQVNGKLKGTIRVVRDAGETDALEAARAQLGIAGAPRKVIYKAGRVLNLVI
jgi:leucyl-tRNA synthetase